MQDLYHQPQEKGALSGLSSVDPSWFPQTQTQRTDIQGLGFRVFSAFGLRVLVLLGLGFRVLVLLG